ncbi:thioesterase II family protein [Kitasatospora sp. NPDC059160]|uniref:thioesterase II family protein n=1 Tax=Kitasatospora sp. NPDC059160 TaxID=3346748 RepID=UPI00367B3CFF
MGDWWTRLGAPAKGAGPRPRRRVVALPHAGGWPSAFRGWREVLPADVELLVAQLPGRGVRLGEAPPTRVEPLVEPLVRELADLTGADPLPYTVVGHSFGSILGYELTRAMEHKGLPPELLAVSARQPPCFGGGPPSARDRTDAQLLAHLQEIGGIAPGLLARADLLGPALRAIRADLEAMEAHQRPLTGTAVPILALGATDDPVVLAERLHLWSLETTAGFRRLMFTGGHFYLYDHANALAVARHLVAPTPPGPARPLHRPPHGAEPPYTPGLPERNPVEHHRRLPPAGRSTPVAGAGRTGAAHPPALHRRERAAPGRTAHQ